MSIRQMYLGGIVKPGFNQLVTQDSGTSTNLYSWGGNNNGEVGNSSISNVSSPVQIGSNDNWAYLNHGPNGNDHTGAIKTNGTLWMWGAGFAGKLGLGNTTSYSSPKQVGALTNWLTISTGYNHSISVKTDGTLWSWGLNDNGQLGLGNRTNYSSPKQVGSLTNWSSAHAGVFASGAVKTNGTLWMWGGNQGSGVLGLGNITYYSSPKQVGSLTDWLRIYVGQYASMAVKTNGTLWSWGRNDVGQLGLNNNNTHYSSPKQVGSLTTWSKGSINGYQEAAAVKTDGTLWMWGANTYGGLGLGNTTNYSSPKQVGSLTNWSDVKIAYAGQGTFALKTNGTLWGWGYNGDGQLGLGNITNYSSPKQVGSLTTWTAIGNASFTVQAIKPDTATPTYATQYSGLWTLQQAHDAIAASTWPTQPVPRLYGWGINNNGKLGLSNTTSYSSPKQVGTLTNWLSLSAGFYSTTSIKTDGTLWTWGSTYGGVLGLGNATAYSSPKQVGALTNWSKTCGNNAYVHSNAAITTSGALYMWGLNNYGQLGLGNTTNYSSPKQVGALTDWLTVASGAYATISIKTNGTLWSWGSNFNGVLGQSLTNINYNNVVNSPVQIGALTTWSKVAILNISAAAIKTDGTLWTWGSNNFGELGLGDRTVRSSPVQVGSLTNWLSITAGQYNFMLAIKTDGTLWAWGANPNGQLGTGNITNYSSPKQVGSLTTWSKVVTGYNHTSAIKTDGTLWSWGYNDNGSLGLGSRTDYSSPKQVGSLTTWNNIANGFYATLGIATI